MLQPSIAVAPGPVPDWARRAVEQGGGTVSAPESAGALVWLDPFGVDALRSLLAACPDLRWVQLPWAGVEDFMASGVFDDHRTWTCAKGVYAEPVAEHALVLGLAGLRDLPERVRAGTWGQASVRSLHDGRVTVLGGGGIARALVALLAPFRAETTVVRRRADPVPGAARTLPTGRLHDALPGADLVVLALSLTPDTEGIIGAPELALMERHSWLVNVARGRHVRTADLVTALGEGWIGGAGLDVTDPEPLPDDHALWRLPNCVVTPHTADTPEGAERRLAARIRENVRRWLAGEELLGPVDRTAGY